MKEDMKNLKKKQEEELVLIKERFYGKSTGGIEVLKRLLSKVRKETALAVCDKMIGEEWKINTKSNYKNKGRSIIKNKGYNQRIKEEKEIAKEIIESL